MGGVEELWQFSGRTLLIVVLVSALWAATTGWAIASWGRLSPVLGAVVGGIGQAPALVVLGVVAIVRESNRRRGERSVDAAPVEVPVDDGWGGSSGWGDLGPSALASTASASGWGDELSSSTASDWGLDPLPTGDPTPPSRQRRSLREIVLPSRWILVAGTLAALVLAATLASPWLRVDAGVIPAILLFPIGTGLDVLVLIGIVLVLAALVALGIRRMRVAAIVLASVADLWLLFALVTLSARESVARVLAEVGAFELTVGDALRVLGVETGGGVIQLPEGVDLSSIGLTGDTVDLSGVELGAVIPNIDVQVSVGIYLLITFAVLANLAVGLVLRTPAPSRDEA